MNHFKIFIISKNVSDISDMVFEQIYQIFLF